MKTWKKALGLVLALVCLTILSGGGLAESVTHDGVTLTRTDKELTAGDYTFSEHLLTIKTAGDYTLSGTASSDDFRVKVGDRLVTTLTLDNLTINTSGKADEGGYSPLNFSEAGATELILVGRNVLTARGQNPAVYAPNVQNDSDLAFQLTIGGEGSLVATGGYAWPGIGNTGSANILIKSGDITAKGGAAAAGIGGSWGFWFDSIVIEGGRVVATGAGANDIGCGADPEKTAAGHGLNRDHKISIVNGVVEAESIYEDANDSKLTKTGGILVQNGEYTVLGNTKLTTNLTIPEGKTLTVPNDKTVTIEKGATLYVDGTVQGNITGNGKIYYKLNYDLDGGEWADGYTPEDYYQFGTEFDLPTEENLNKAGYKFLGWKDKDTGDEVGKIPTNATGIKNVVAQWAKKYTVTFNANGGTETSETRTVTYGNPYGELPTLTRDGYTFAGWFTKMDGGTQVTKETVVTTAADHMLYAHWTRISYEVKFDANGGIGTCKPINVFHGDTYGTFPPEPTLEGYEFAGWYTAEKDGTLVTEDTVVTASHTLYAHWTANEYTVTFDANKGTVTPTEMKVRHGDAYGKLPTPTLDGYTFDGWYNDNGMQVKPEDEVTASHTLYAHWKASTYTVTFEANEGTAEPKPQTVIYGSTYGKLPTLTRDGYTFAGWFTEQNGGTKVMADTKVKTAKDHTLYAHWTAKKYTVKFNANGGTVEPADAEMTVTYGNPYGKLPEPTRKGYTFVGWFTNPNGGTQVKADAEVTTAANRTLHAHWTQNIYTVTIKADKDGKVIETQQIPEGGLAKKPAKEPVREGYTFIGWQANGAAWDFDQNVVERDTEIIALWEKVVIAPDVAIEGGTSFIVGRATENAMVTIGHNVPGFGVANLAYVDVDGKKLNEKDYDAKTGSIKLNVHAAYLNTLSVGEHTLTAHLKGDGYDGQKVSAKLTVSPVPDASGLPKTGDASAPMVWCALGLACLAGLAAMKRRK